MVLARLYNVVPVIVCEIFSIIIHFLYLAFFSWTGNKNVLMTYVYRSDVLVVEGYFFYRALVVVFNRRKLTALVYYVIGYGVPTVIVIVLVLVNVLTGVEMYLRRNDQGTLESCFLSVEAMPAIAVPAGVSLMVYDGRSHVICSLQVWSLYSTWPSQ